MAQAFTIGAFGIIRDDKNRILLCLRNDYDLRNLPGGGVEDGESPREAVIREVKEETGLNVEILRLIGIYDKPTTNDIVFSFECKKIGGELTLNEESKDIRYFPRSEIPHNTGPKQIERIDDLLDNKKEIIMKIQTRKSTIQMIKEGLL